MRAGYCCRLLATLVVFDSASAAPIDLFQWIYYADGVLYDSMGGLGSSLLPANFSSTPPTTGALGITTVTVFSAGNHNFVSFLITNSIKPQTDFPRNMPAFSTSPASPRLRHGRSMNLGLCSVTFMTTSIEGPRMDNTNAVPSGAPDDVSVAFGWQFNLLAGDTATITLMVAETPPSSGFYISHFDVGADTKLFYSTTLSINSLPTPTPEPSSVLLVLTGLPIAYAAKFWRRRT